MSSLEEIDKAVEILEKYSQQYGLMYTNSAYPTPVSELNINCIKTLKSRYNCTVGYSGHEYDLEPTVFAVALGAKIIERHITLDHKMWGTDQSSSIEPMGMDALAKRIKNVDIILGDGIKKVTKSEISIRNKLRGK
jgi:N-acetylneuraminate synthase